MSEHEFEAVRGLPGDLPEGEKVLWQGAPDWWLLALGAFKIHWVAGYFAILGVWSFVENLVEHATLITAFEKASSVLPLAIIALGLLMLLAWINARSTVYTITSHRIVMRFGAALTKAINIPYKIIESAAVDVRPNGSGTVAIKLAAPNKIPLLLLWPHRRPHTFLHPEPAFRAIKNASVCAPILAEALRKAHDQPHVVTNSFEVTPEPSGLNQPAMA